MNEEQMIIQSEENGIEMANKKQKVDWLVVIVLVAIFLGIVVNFFSKEEKQGSESYQEAAEQYIEALYLGDTETVLGLFHEKMIKASIREGGYENYNQFFEYIDAELHSQLENQSNKFSNDWDGSYSIMRVIDAEDDTLEKFRNEYKQQKIRVKVSEMKFVEIQVTITGETYKITITDNLPVVKIGDSWYADSVAMQYMGDFID